MAVNRRRMFQSLALGSACGPTAAQGQESSVTLELLRNVSTAHGSDLSDERLQVLQPVIANRLQQLRSIREFAVDDAVEPTQGILG